MNEHLLVTLLWLLPHASKKDPGPDCRYPRYVKMLRELGVRNSNALLLMIFTMAEDFRPKIIRVNNRAVDTIMFPNNEVAINEWAYCFFGSGTLSILF